MSLFAHLLATRTKEELAKTLVQTAKENAVLRDRVGELEHALFWAEVELRKNGDEIPSNSCLPARPVP